MTCPLYRPLFSPGFGTAFHRDPNAIRRPAPNLPADIRHLFSTGPWGWCARRKGGPGGVMSNEADLRPPHMDTINSAAHPHDNDRIDVVARDKPYWGWRPNLWSQT